MNRRIFQRNAHVGYHICAYLLHRLRAKKMRFSVCLNGDATFLQLGLHSEVVASLIQLFSNRSV